jgi:hypothetical protein
MLIVLTAFLALTAFAGGIGLLANFNAPPVELLEGSPFSDYTIPGMLLFVVVGGSAGLAAYLLIRRHPVAALGSVFAGLAILSFEVVEVVVIGSEPGVARSLQIFYFSLGALILITSLTYRWVRSASHRPAEPLPT